MTFYIQRTKTTPYALINDGYMKIAGKAVPIEEHNFFGVINKQVDKYIQVPQNITCVDLSLSVLNASSKRSIISLLNQLEALNSTGFQVQVNWWYEADDEDVKEFGEILKDMFKLDFNIQSK
ncbi:MAG: SiaC family regulatory phosphoprotein [Bacteroidales bacterium]|nr:SiaC family regulatory phosphoprotein [Bacteroidales bacterium]MBN2817424.1 SiaC family regulatory phosphoprotein [Bacteroidales bacterium]